MKYQKTLMIIAVFHPYIGGAENQAKKLALELLDKDLEVTVVSGRWSNALRRKENHNGLNIVRNLTNFKFWGNKQEDKETDFFKPDLSLYEIRFKYARVLLRKIFIRTSIYIYQTSLFFFLLRYRNNYDIIHVHQVLFPAFTSALCARILKKPIVAKVGSSGFNSDINQIKKFPEGRSQLRFILNNIDRLVCTTSKMKEEFIEEGIDKDKITLLPNGVRMSEFKRSYDKCGSLVYLGRFNETKNIETLILAFSRVILNIDKKLKLVLVGDGPERNNINELIRKLDLEENILLPGMIKDPSSFLKDSDLFVFPSLIEGLSNSLIEAMSYKLPCIVSNIPGNIEVIGKAGRNYNIESGKYFTTEYGVLFNPEDIDGLYNALLFMINNKKIRKEIGQSAYQKVNGEYDIRLIAEKYRELYSSLIKRK